MNPSDADEPRPVGADRSDADRTLIDGLRRRDEAAFVALVGCYQGSLLRLALTHVANRAVAEEVVQETWVGVMHGIDRFEGRSSLKTWIFTILTNQAKRRGVREQRSIPFSAFDACLDGSSEPAVDPDRFRPVGDKWAGGWKVFPRPWDVSPEDGMEAAETRERIEAAIATLPPGQRQVITLRDVEGWAADEVCALLGLTEGNQRVLLHRARSKVRQALEDYYDGVGSRA
ncbi:MAG TPA: sigma-70 family RNA polymerase sigma factor [Thermomicrobiales bacterium]|nr:sigma-70 family RNA polymerase sigma factor [Thermomicrobiales bacterium]